MYLFVLGRNPEISKLEIYSLLRKLEIDAAAYFDLGSELLVNAEIPEETLKLLLNRLGGTLKIVSVMGSIENEINESFFDQIDFYYPKNFHLYVNYSSSVVKNDLEVLENCANSFKKSNKLKGTIEFLESSDLKPQATISRNPDSAAEVVITKSGSMYVFGKVIGYTDSKQFIDLDTKRPNRRNTHGTAFRLARIMTNIHPAPKGATILDPFCGTGTYLIEGMIDGYNMVGVDNDPQLIKDSNANLAWFKSEYKPETNVEVIFGESQTAEYLVNGCIFEPYMGPFLKDTPTKKDAKKVMQKLYNLYLAVFRNLRAQSQSHNGAKVSVVCILPEFNTTDSEIVAIPKDLFSQAGLKITEFPEIPRNLELTTPIPYSAADGSIIRRNLWVLEFES